jgi:hypothetical protein
MPDEWFVYDFYASTVVIPIKASFVNLLNESVDAATVIELMEQDKKMLSRDNYNFYDGHIE